MEVKMKPVGMAATRSIRSCGPLDLGTAYSRFPLTTANIVCMAGNKVDIVTMIPESTRRTNDLIMPHNQLYFDL